MPILNLEFARRLCKNKQRLSLVECEDCKAEYITSRDLILKKKNHFCGSCRRKGKLNHQFGKRGELCHNFGEKNPFYGKTHSPEMRKKLSAFNKELYKDKRNHPSFNPLLKDEDRQPRDSKHDEWAKLVKIRDDFTCQISGIRGGDLISHHLDSWKNFPDKRFNIDNGITINKYLHLVFHSIYGNKNNTKEQFLEFKMSILKSYC